MTMTRLLAACTTLFLMIGCAQRMPTLPNLSSEPLPPVEDTEDWENWGPEVNKQQRAAAIEGDRLTTEQITQAFQGRVMRGCYPNGESFAETLAEDGRFYDSQDNGRLLGTWAARNAQLCFRYPARAQAGEPDACFAVVRVANRYDFYSPDLEQKVASTGCTR